MPGAARRGVELEVVVLSSGTAAVHLALIECGAGPRDEVLMPRRYAERETLRQVKNMNY